MEHYLIVEEQEGDIVEVELSNGLRTELPLAWLPAGASNGAGFRVEVGVGQISFVPDERAARFVRERNKQTLLEFTDEVE
ncbi:hypothetical protein [Deinococcus peraridilitoris]|uniref:DUF3006 domain-containing protein n=1 Tax=Deinococcus peraridilitoris (strain DSM 19664 / LMG 22246 / CIP 109416 / KR-200) TaxID=937777 RepID=K9ZZU2_DEIPD|nr:hypothetical protein [Deinococcus peraridilitoris]AFZ66290.1 hypothetical protein Deipe_0711 [Deinococcus peraridilitoris DSM 19664]